ncbi:fumarylacetoacetate hydrolase family protein [Streptomyces turgidiscabies]|uniref:FAH family protein n=1 Tax=Streptomyces turgidiscabies (strain Car8) TaxID=698760 RepID=L7F3W6_STRT8|nr:MULTISPECIES: fumarylacetoacetate hydrolase family protein [Streptomyces]ELP65320.1 FAH family protein [Streptomyces turgidiscabies Car8]MDX3491065.1 fumarylacetoacetate hydrolase family protein [Streptomyces turgidiscabies]GAQ72915.1 homoprotocatechuate catabolism bifunctional isomerase/decarboxylase [Streptomyces turgidiscabies]
MRIVRYAVDGVCHYGEMEAGDVRVARFEGDPFTGLSPTGKIDEVGDVVVLAPLDRPRVFGFAYNYASHIDETDREVPEVPVCFMKPSTAVIGPDDAIVYPADGELIHFEGELVVVIGKEARRVKPSEAHEYILGYTCGNDVSDRIVQRKESAFGTLLIGKGQDTFAPLGPVIETELDPSNLSLTTRVNGSVTQSASTADLLLDVPGIVSYLSRYLTLLPGDAIMTGTPAGVGPIRPGDEVEVEIEGIGVLRNPVVAEGV